MHHRDALGDKGDPAADATPTSSGQPAASQALTTHRPPTDAPPLDHGGARAPVSRGADRGRTFIAAGTPGENFQTHVLEHFQSIVSFSPLDPLCASTPGNLWLTPPFLSPCFSAKCVENLLNFFLCAPPERLRVSLVAPNVFKTCFASVQIARYVVVWGPYQLPRFDFGLHLNLEDAMDAALRVPAKDPLPVKAVKQGINSPTTRDTGSKWKVPAVTSAAGLLALPVASVVSSPSAGMAVTPMESAAPSCVPLRPMCAMMAWDARRRPTHPPPSCCSSPLTIVLASSPHPRCAPAANPHKNHTAPLPP